MIVFLGNGMTLDSAGLIIAAFVGSLLSLGLIIPVSGRAQKNYMLIVCGIMIGYICSAVTEFVVTFADDSNIVNLHNWSMGSFSGIGMDEAGVMSAVVLAAMVPTFLLSHPKVYDSTALLEELASKHEIDGVEVWHQSADEQYRAQLQDIAAANGLLVTGGSDFHGFYNHYAIQIGSNTTPEESLNRIITHKGKA